MCTYAGSGILQVFPSDPSYSCTTPSLRFKCTFPVGVSTALWSFPGSTNIRDGYPGHAIDNRMIHDGVSYLMVNSSSHLKDRYSCLAIYNITSTEQYTLRSPPVASEPIQQDLVNLKLLDNYLKLPKLLTMHVKLCYCLWQTILWQ